MRKILLLTVVTLTLTTPAKADWQYTHWGMTPDQVAKASGGNVSVGSGTPGDKYEGADIGAVGTYTSGEHQYDAVFYFKNDRLIDIHLKLKNATKKQWLVLKNSLDDLYGKPFKEIQYLMSLTTYHDKSKNNRVDLFMIGDDSVTLEYRPLKDESASGL